MAFRTRPVFEMVSGLHCTARVRLCLFVNIVNHLIPLNRDVGRAEYLINKFLMFVLN
jgi:hypothetical protein